MDAINQLLDLVKQGGAGAALIMAWLYWQERQERRETQEKHERTVAEALSTMAKTEAALRAMSDIMGAHK